jgi:hypothetical protein
VSPWPPTDPREREALLGGETDGAGVGVGVAGDADPVDGAGAVEDEGAADDGDLAKVRVRCDACGPRVIGLDGVRLLDRRSGAIYVFTCDRCGSRVRRPADAALRGALLGAGVSGLTLLGGEGVMGLGESG